MAPSKLTPRLLLCALVITVVICNVEAQCSIPWSWRRGIRWWTHYTADPPSKNDVSLVQFNETFLLQMTLPVQGESTCELTTTNDKYRQMSFKKFYGDRFCAEGYLLDSNAKILLFRQSPEERSFAAIPNAKCTDTLGQRDRLQVFVSYEFAPDPGQSNYEILRGDCQLDLGRYRLEYQNAAGPVMCSGMTSSNIDVSTNELNLQSCYTGSWDYGSPWNGRLQCVQQFSGVDIFDQKNGYNFLLLAYKPSLNSLPVFYCARYGFDIKLQRMVIDLYAESKSSVSCVARVSDTFNKKLILRTAECDSLPCTNGGTCQQGWNTYTCACAAGYTGTLCETTGCLPVNPCQNGGVCAMDAATTAGYKCDCPASWAGDTCQIPKPCSRAPCLNGGSCLDQGLNYICQCVTGWIGQHCEVPSQGDVCSPTANPCLNGGTCEANAAFRDGYICTCRYGWQGRNCQERTRCYLTQPCQNGGSCYSDASSTSGYRCECLAPYSGPTCSRRDPNLVPIASTCSMTCINGGACVADTNGQYCSCPESYIYSGRSCSERDPWFIVGVVMLAFLLVLFLLCLSLCLWWCCGKSNRALPSDQPPRTSTGGSKPLIFGVTRLTPSQKIQVLP